eukprot:TRINITY_DN13941_c0_g1_i3.p1 TRINITY_DN13941_c0_g1~~TRINITY_DN13941_c0_g1_i3.p1  ORF type:complete len:507 (+),score=115.20 TRINITY_DN13941_c0_g1_i3:119-1639(+)
MTSSVEFCGSSQNPNSYETNGKETVMDSVFMDTLEVINADLKVDDLQSEDIYHNDYEVESSYQSTSKTHQPMHESITSTGSSLVVATNMTCESLKPQSLSLSLLKTNEHSPSHAKGDDTNRRNKKIRVKRVHPSHRRVSSMNSVMGSNSKNGRYDNLDGNGKKNRRSSSISNHNHHHRLLSPKSASVLNSSLHDISPQIILTPTLKPLASHYSTTTTTTTTISNSKTLNNNNENHSPAQRKMSSAARRASYALQLRQRRRSTATKSSGNEAPTRAMGSSQNHQKQRKPSSVQHPGFRGFATGSLDEFLYPGNQNPFVQLLSCIQRHNDDPSAAMTELVKQREFLRNSEHQKLLDNVHEALGAMLEARKLILEDADLAVNKSKLGNGKDKAKTDDEAEKLETETFLTPSSQKNLEKAQSSLTVGQKSLNEVKRMLTTKKEYSSPFCPPTRKPFSMLQASDKLGIVDKELETCITSLRNYCQIESEKEILRKELQSSEPKQKQEDKTK